MEHAVFDREQALSAVDGDKEIFKEFVGLFLGECPRAMAEIHAAINRGDASRLNQASQSPKGSVGNFGVRPAF